MIDGVNAAGTMLDAGKTKALVVLQRQRSQFLPDTPTLAEAGYPQAAENIISYVMAAPKGTPAPIIDKLQRGFAEALRDPAVLEQIKPCARRRHSRGRRKRASSWPDSRRCSRTSWKKKHIKF